ncbi:pirin family protein [Kistimonas scapharcae]|uniref:Pirin family protein n=1 Tax=Kistimonas scapharcae TaxID=1036133 RepID=A0ABP8V3M0_9GAMM
MDYFRPADSRGHEQTGWLDSRHTFSFGSYYDPRHMGLSVLRVINDDTVAPGAGFDTHGHRDMEIISYVMEGVIEHQDSLGNRFVVPAGEVQRMSAGSGILHSEYNASCTDNLRFLQIWIKPNVQGIKPGYAQANIEQTGQLTPLVTPDGRANSLPIHQNASLYRLRLAAGESKTLEAGSRQGYLQVIRGLASSEKITLQAGDGVGVITSDTLTVVAEDDGFEALWFDLP